MKVYKYLARSVWGANFEFVDSCWPVSDKIFRLMEDNNFIRESSTNHNITYKVCRVDGPVPQTIYVYERNLVSDEGAVHSNGRLICTIVPEVVG